MTGGRLARMEALFRAALERTAGERASFLESEEADAEGARLVASVREPLLAQSVTSPAERAMIERIGRDCGAK
jgi:hypothetical protein